MLQIYFKGWFYRLEYLKWAWILIFMKIKIQPDNKFLIWFALINGKQVQKII